MARYASELRSGVRAQYIVEQVLAANPMLPDVDTAREFWIPTEEEAAELATIAGAQPREARRTQMYAAWRQANLAENARRKALNEVAKTRIDLEVKDIKERGDTVNKIMGEISEEMTKTSRDRIEKYMRSTRREREAWLFIFEVARETHTFQGVASDRVLMYEKQEKEYLSKMKHITGDFNRWITRSENQMETCETIGVDLSEEAKILYFMNNLNDSIFGDIKANFLDLSTRALSPQPTTNSSRE